MGVNKINIKKSDIIFLDSNIFIYALEDNNRPGDLSRSILQDIKDNFSQAFTSVLTLEETLTKVFEKGLEEKISSYLDFISGGGAITIVGFERDIALISARLRGTFNKQNKKLRTPDAIQLATALFVKANIFITADKRIPSKIENMSVQTIL